MNPEGSLPTGTIAVAARHFDLHRSIIDRIYKKIKPKSENERSIADEERQDIVLFLRQRMNSEGSLPLGTNTEAASRFGRSHSMISQIYKELKPKSAYERIISDQERQDIISFLRLRLKADGSLPHGTINEAAEHFSRNRNTIKKISKELKPVSASRRVITGQERQDIMMFLSQRMNPEGSLPTGTIAVAARHFDLHRSIIDRIYMKIKPKSANERSIRDEER
jgi:hypothetical protein